MNVPLFFCEMKKLRLALFASGTGSNVLNLITYFREHSSIEIAFVLSNKKDAAVVSKAKEEGVQIFVCSNEEANDVDFLENICSRNNIDYIILAGYLRLIPAGLIANYANRIINIHPSLLPKFGGKGMYGNHVHEAVIQSKEKESGISIHYVNAHFDEGNLIAQFHCKITEDETVDSLRGKIQHLEQTYFPFIVEQTILLH